MVDLKILCLLIDHEKKAAFGDVFDVEVHSNAYISDLKRKVKEGRPGVLGNVDLAMLTVWRCTDSEIDFGDVDSDNFNDRLNEIFSHDKEKVKKLNPMRGVDQFKGEILFIEVPASEDIKLIEEARDTPSELPAIKRRDVTLAKFRESMSVDNFDGIKKAHQRLFTGRMDDRYGHPVALFHKELALLQQRLQMLDAQVKTGQDWSDPKHPEEPIKLTVKLLNAAKEYFVTSRGCYEEQQWYEIRVFFEWIFGKKAWRSDTVWGNYAILVCKNATGLDGDASLEAAVWYGKNCHRMKEGIYKHSKLPVIIVGVMGNVLEISIGVCLEEVVVDKILHFEVLDSPNRNETVVKLTLIASALETCADELRDEYRDLERTSGPVEEETWHLPCPSATAFSPNSLIPELEFKAKLSRRNEKLTKLKGENAEMRSLFLATYCGRGVIVKFAVTYNDSAHTAVADQNHAPRLHTCEQVIGGLKMVVMERVHGKRMCDEDGNSLPRNVFEDLGKALRIIHDKDLVFGDLRDTNVMITKSDVKVEAKLIDFDWVDKDGKGRYPPLINTELTKKELSPEIGPWRFMHKSHDKYALSKLISKYCDDPVYINTKCEELMR